MIRFIRWYTCVAWFLAGVSVGLVVMVLAVPTAPRHVYVYVYNEAEASWDRVRTTQVNAVSMERLGYFECGPDDPERRR